MTSKITLTLRGGHCMEISLPGNSPLMPRLRQLANKRTADHETAGNGLLQIPLEGGNECLMVSVSDINDVTLPNHGEHPLMNTSEGHLGGYITARHPRSAEMGMEHGDSATWCPDLWRWLVEELAVSSVLDVGCGEGHAAAFFADLGCRVSGVDGSAVALRDTFIPGLHVLHDYNTGPFKPESEFQLVWSCEFVEHVEAQFEENFLASFDSASRFILMTAAPPGQRGWHHVNCQPPEYWIERIERRGFCFSEALTTQARALAAKGHFSRQGLVFLRPAEKAFP